MYICLCHPFSDRDVREYLTKNGESATVGKVYKACSNGEKPQCCTCIQTLKDMLSDHNDTAAEGV
ncbi:MAG: (2Fe-2S)-binding protein [Rhodospirillales bacterium]|nr:(2Fe-2S)-binding protein [Rhodospirillales bacterium]MCB9995142.1 (2Fe-2S)-binding protein [Rhodospirillales bacterium]